MIFVDALMPLCSYLKYLEIIRRPKTFKHSKKLERSVINWPLSNLMNNIRPVIRKNISMQATRCIENWKILVDNRYSTLSGFATGAKCKKTACSKVIIWDIEERRESTKLRSLPMGLLLGIHKRRKFRYRENDVKYFFPMLRKCDILKVIMLNLNLSLYLYCVMKLPASLWFLS